MSFSFGSHFPLSAESRMGLALQILKCALIPFVPERLRASGIDPLAQLPPSSPVLKHGFEPDARAAFRILSAQPDAFAAETDAATLTSCVKTLTRLRDKWAHQQELDQKDATRFTEAACQLSQSLNRQGEALALRKLTRPPPNCFEHLRSLTLESLDGPVLEFQTLIAWLELDPDDMTDADAVHSALIWETACAITLSQPPLSLLVRFPPTRPGDPGNGYLPGESFWWALGLSHDAPPETRNSAYNQWCNTLDPAPGWP